MSDQPFEVREKPVGEAWDKRWILIDPITDKVLDDAQGYGYKSKQSAVKAGWYKFGAASGNWIQRPKMLIAFGETTSNSVRKFRN